MGLYLSLLMAGASVTSSLLSEVRMMKHFFRSSGFVWFFGAMLISA